MRFFLDLEEHNGSYELDSWQPETTIADLIQATGGPSLPADEPLYCDNRPVTASSTLAEVKPMEGMRISRAPLSYPSLVQGWSVCLSGGSPAAPYPFFASSGGGSFPVRRHCAAHGERLVGASAPAGGS